MLYGEYQHNMDTKGRVTIPFKFREDLGDKFYVCKGLDCCLFILSQEQWDLMREKLTSMPVAKSREVQRHFYAGATEVETDKQGRILLQQNLREYANITKEVTVIGVGSRAEIWDTNKWNAYNEGITQESLESAMEALGI